MQIQGDMDSNDGHEEREENDNPSKKQQQKRKRGKTSLTLGTGKRKKSKHELSSSGDMDSNDGQEGREDNDNPSKKQQQKRKRGKTSLTLGIGKGKKSKHELNFNVKGQPAGPSRVLTSTDVGKICRTHVPINCKTWKHVPKSVKDKILEVMEENYYCNKFEGWQKRLMRKVGLRFRDFKNKLYTQYILPHARNVQNISKDPPEVYSTITKDQWTDFVAQRTSKSWSQVRKQAQGNRAKNIYNHRIARKGYAGLEEEIQEERNTIEPIERHTLWKKGRQNKSGSYDNEAIKKQAENIDKIAAEVENGSLTVEGSNDVLTQALGTDESYGHVRGVGALVTPTQYFHALRPKCTSCETIIAEVSDLKKYMLTMATLIGQHGLQVPPFSQSNSREENIGSNSVKNNVIHIGTQEECAKHGERAKKAPAYSSPLTQGPMERNKENVGRDDVHIQTDHDPWPSDDMPHARPCQLANPTIHRVVAHGYVYELGDANIIHGIPQGDGNVRVSVLDLINDEYRDEPLPVPNADAEHLGETIGGFVSWPRQLVILKDTMVEATPRDGVLEQLIFQFTQLVDKATRDEPKDAILVTVDQNAFQTNDPNSKPMEEIPIFKDELLHLINFEEIGCTLMKLYMCALFNRVKEIGVDSSIRFAEPAGVSGNFGKHNSDILYYNIDAASSKEDCIFLYPYNIGFHWVLAVVDPKKRYMWYLDPLGNSIDVNLIETLKFMFKSLDYNFKFKSSKKLPTFKRATCPKQIGTIECGYYVLRYMKDIIESHGTHPVSLFHSTEPYSTKMIDEVRADLIVFIRDHM